MRIKRLRIASALTVAALGACALLLGQTSGGFRFRGLLSRVIVPKNATFNRLAIFCVDNPSDSGIDAKIFDLHGSEVSDLGPGTGDQPAVAGCPQDSPVPFGARSFRWNGTSNGVVVHSGVYIYQVKAEGLTFTGTLLVVR